MALRCTLLATRKDIEAVFGIRDAIECVENAFRLYGEGKVEMPPKVYLTFPKGDLRTMPACLPSVGAAGVKNVNVHPDNRDVPTVMATITLVDPQDGYPLAVMDGTYITALRTGAAGAVAARLLARPDSQVAGFIGAGRQAHTQLDALRVTMPGLKQALACDARPEAAETFCRWCEDEHGLQAEPVADAADLVPRCDVLTTTTPAHTPVVRDQWVRPGTHISAIGADAAGKQELAPAILERAVIVIDNWEQASHSGEINVALKDGVIARQDIHADIGQVITGRRPGRSSAEQITVFDSTGLAIQDISCAFEVYERLNAGGRGTAEPGGIAFF